MALHATNSLPFQERPINKFLTKHDNYLWTNTDQFPRKDWLTIYMIITSFRPLPVQFKSLNGLS